MNKATEWKHNRYKVRGKTHVVDVATSNTIAARKYHSLGTPHFAIYLSDENYSSEVYLDEDTARFVRDNLNEFITLIDMNARK